MEYFTCKHKKKRMVKTDYRAIYIFCDVSMMPDSQSSGGTGYLIRFPDEFEIEDMSDYYGIYLDSNIERLEIEGLIRGMSGLYDWLRKSQTNISWISRIIVITDRYELQDERRTNPFRIKDWRSNGGKNHKGKEIKNWDLLNQLDKTRTKLAQLARKSVRIEYRKRKYNKEADKLSKKGRKEGLPTRKIAIEGHKIGRRVFEGGEIKYKYFNPKETITIHIFRKRPIKEQWEINAEICSEKRKGEKLRVIVDHLLQEKLQRGNVFEVRIKNIYSFHFEIYRTIKKVDKKKTLEK
jgi:ribonuclease HI